MHNVISWKSLTAAATLLISVGLAAPASAGFIDMDFTTMGAASSTVSGLGPAIIGVPLTGAYSGLALNIEGRRSSIPIIDPFGDPPPYESGMRLTRNTNGIGLCSRVKANGDCSMDQDTVDGLGPTESIKFVIVPGLEFAVQTITFGDARNVPGTIFTPPTFDDANMVFKAGGLEIEFNIVDEGGCNPISGAACTVNIYNLVQNHLTGDQTEDQIYAYLASTDGFTFEALDLDDNWYIRGARWVTVPEPASMTLLGAGVLGLGYFGKRRQA